MKEIHFIITNYSNQDISKIPFDKYDELCYNYGFEPNYYIVASKKQEECNRALCMAFEHDNENSAISKALTGLKGNVIVMSSRYADRLDILEQFLQGLLERHHLIRVRHAFRGIISIISEACSKVYNIFVRLLTGAQDVLCIKNFVAFNNVVLEMINMFPNKFGLISNSNFLGNLNVGEVMVEAEFKAERSKIAFKFELILGILFSLISVASLALIFILPFSFNTILWLLIAVLVFALLGVTFTSKNVLDNKMLCKTKKEKKSKQEKQEN